jgi:hypothetical protein
MVAVQAEGVSVETLGFGPGFFLVPKQGTAGHLNVVARKLA